jgi:hypothetical protein
MKYKRSSLCILWVQIPPGPIFTWRRFRMKEKQSFPTRDELDQAFTILQDQITRITVAEEEEMIKQEKEQE